MTIPKIPSGQMYLAWSNARMHYVALRWAKAVGFITLNGVAGGIFYQSFSPVDPSRLWSLLFISLIMAWLNWQWYRLSKRTNEWIELYVRKLEEMEKASGTESGVTLFSDPAYLSRPQDKKDTKVSATQFVSEMSIIILALWVLLAFVCFCKSLLLMGEERAKKRVVVEQKHGTLTESAIGGTHAK